jgi:hypothetical protein
LSEASETTETYDARLLGRNCVAKNKTMIAGSDFDITQADSTPKLHHREIRRLIVSKRKEYEDKVKAKLKEIESDVQHFKAKIAASESKLTEEHKLTLDRVQRKWSETKNKADELLQASDEKFEHFQTGMEHYYTAIGNELKAYERKITKATQDSHSDSE